uniref:BZIP domain-containing protein n=1 Tax=Compsopogon caeruleus TaxID=31354 RepID=A0A7S1T8U6_9RHOD|mmetsp:Transcript_13214/g.26824  ORF Transcript_13214/g.26824 Transcript_13214/m.26824 type:complete len:136 (+) Transcript_13214:155-562(+)
MEEKWGVRDEMWEVLEEEEEGEREEGDVEREEEKKRRVRMERNRQSAKRSRKKMKDYVEGMERQLENLEKENGTLVGKLDVLNSTIATLPTELLDRVAAQSLDDSEKFVEVFHSRRRHTFPSVQHGRVGHRRTRR